MKKVILYATLMILFLTACNAQEQARSKKDHESAKNGLSRTLKVYSQGGEVLETYTGKFDIDPDTTGQKIKFDIPKGDGTTKRIIIYNALAICEEE